MAVYQVTVEGLVARTLRVEADHPDLAVQKAESEFISLLGALSAEFTHLKKENNNDDT